MHSQKKYTNKLINESSPYLLQHAHNPVDWHPWNEETLRKAGEENKMLLISIGYSACHWCHVMEKESFENEKIADIMNRNFVCIKVDREERPDVDAVYMNAVQLIHGNGGWPLNCFALPDGKPFYGGTYFQPQQWEVLLKNVADLYKNRKHDLEQQAQQILEGITQENLIKVENDTNDSGKQLMQQATKKWAKNFDSVNGGSKGAPKFLMPGAIQFLLEYAQAVKDQDIMKHVELTLDKMMMGGIYDQVGGGFARYSVDAEWKVPHFEKMLYDNAQLITLYTLAFQITKKGSYLETARETADFVLRELTSDEGAFFSALDADSEGEEGKFYVWTKQEFDKILGEHSGLFKAYFEIDREAHWEGDKNVLMRKYHPETFAGLQEIKEAEFLEQLNQAKQLLYDERSKRVRPGLDDKSLTSWSAMMIKALVRLSVVADEQKYLHAALKSAKLIMENNLREDGSLMHSYKNGKATINGFLEDYAHFADAAIELFQVTMDESWLRISEGIAKYAVANFYDEKEGFFWFTSNEATDLVSRKKEIYDNVIPSSNAVMGHVLFKVSLLTGNKTFGKIVNEMTANIAGQVAKYAPSLYCWAQLIHQTSGNFNEVVITGPEAKKYLKEIYSGPHPGKIVAGAIKNSALTIFKNRFKANQTMIYVCSNNVCSKPVDNVEYALKQMG